MRPDKQLVHHFWESASCGEDLYLSAGDYTAQSKKRYELEPYISGFANFDGANAKRVLEVGVGLGADHERFARAGAILTGVDLTARAVGHTRTRFIRLGLTSDLRVADAEALPFADESFDIVYSWGVMHHSPDTQRAINEAWRVLNPGGSARVMIYHRYSLVGFMLWLRYGIGRKSLTLVYSEHLESPGTKAYSAPEAKAMFSRFSDVTIRTVLTHGDLLTSQAGQRHRGKLLSLAKAIWPRRFFRAVCPWAGLFMLIEARK